MALIFEGGGINPDQTQISQPITPGIIVAASVRELFPLIEPYSLYATIGIGVVQPGAQVQVRIRLASGYIHRRQSLTWTGFYPLEPNDHLFLTLNGDLRAPVEAHVRRLPNVTVQLIERLLSAQSLPA